MADDMKDDEGNHYIFHSKWLLYAPLRDAFAVLNDFETYPVWWPEVRSIEPTENGYRTVCRSLLPYDLVFDTERGATDETAGVIEGKLRGDIEGWSRWQLHSEGEGVRLVYDQEVDLTKQSLNRIAPVVRPAFRLNHALMMRHGRQGLAVYLAGYQRGAAAG